LRGGRCGLGFGLSIEDWCKTREENKTDEEKYGWEAGLTMHAITPAGDGLGRSNFER
jgi:hypothetical protein